MESILENNPKEENRPDGLKRHTQLYKHWQNLYISNTHSNGLGKKKKDVDVVSGNSAICISIST